MDAVATSHRSVRGAVFVVQVWVVTRLALFLLAVFVAGRTSESLTTVLGHWDVEHFVAVAQQGYAEPTDMAFFPGLPLAIRLLSSTGLDAVASATVIAVATSALAAWALYRIAGPGGAVAWLLAPTSVFTFVGYSESPFCAAAFWAWERASRGRWGSAAGFAALACTLRVSGLFLVGALGILAVVQAWRGRSDAGHPGLTLARTASWLLVPLAVLGGYATYLYTLTGDWKAWYSAQSKGWMREFTWPWDCLAHHWAAIQPGMYADHPGWVEVFRAELACWVLGLVLVVVLLARRRLAEAAWIGVQVLAFSLSYWLQSVCRAVLLWFPLYQLIGEAVERRTAPGWRTAWGLAAAASFVLQAVWALTFYQGMWAS